MDVSNDEIEHRTVWTKCLSRMTTEGTTIIGEKFAKIVCIREVSGYAVWYIRQLEEVRVETDGFPLDGSYLLKFFSPTAREEAIEFAERVAGLRGDNWATIAQLDDFMRVAFRGRSC